MVHVTTRPHIPLSVQRDAALIQLGLDPKAVELDHDPALSRRRRCKDGSYEPPANDPAYLKWRTIEGHKLKTFGTKNTRRGADIPENARDKRISAAHREFMLRQSAKLTGKIPPRRKHKRAWPSRPFPKRNGVRP